MAIFFPSFIHCCEWVWNDTLCSNFIAFFWNHISSGFYPLFSASESQSVENKLVYLLKLFDYSSIFSCWRVVFLFELINCSENSLLKPDRVGISGYTKISYLNRQLIIPPLVLSHQWALMICPPPLSPPRERCSLPLFILFWWLFSSLVVCIFSFSLPSPFPSRSIVIQWMITNFRYMRHCDCENALENLLMGCIKVSASHPMWDGSDLIWFDIVNIDVKLVAVYPSTHPFTSFSKKCGKFKPRDKRIGCVLRLCGIGIGACFDK